MTIFVLECHDKSDGTALRAEHLTVHRAYLSEHASVVKLAGPLLDDADRSIGSLIFLDCVSLDQARTFGAQDPFARVGLFSSVTVREFQPEIGFDIKTS